METSGENQLEQQAILVLGMHRSGTSALTRVLNLLGAEVGPDLLPPAPDNPSGFWEHRGVNAVQDRILDAMGREWLDVTPLPSGWMQQESVTPLLAELEQLLRNDFGSARLWTVKDPRICLLLQAWEPILHSMNCRGTCALILRNPLEVVKSLEKRDKLGRPRLYMLWLRYLLDSELHSRSWPRAIVRYEHLLTDWRKQVEILGSRLGANWPVSPDQAATEIDKYLEPSLRHHSVTDEQLLADESVPSIVRQTYRAFLETEHGDDAAFRSQMDAIRQQLNQADDLLKSYLSALQIEARGLAKGAAEIRSQMDQAAEQHRQILGQTLQALESEGHAAGALQQDLAAAAKAQEQLRQSLDESRETLAKRDMQISQLQIALDEQRQLTEQARRSERDTAIAIERQRELHERNREEMRLAADGLQRQISDLGATLEQTRQDLIDTRQQSNSVRLRADALERVATRVQVSLGWKLTESLRSFLRHIHPLQFVMTELIASEQLQPLAPGRWMVTGTGAHFLLPLLPVSNWMRLDVKMWSGVRGRMELYFDNGAGFGPSQRLDLGEASGATVVSAVYRVPNGTRLLKWVPLDRAGEIRVERCDITVLPSWLVYARLTGRTARRVGVGSMMRGAGLLLRGHLGEFLMHLRTASPPPKSETQKSAEPTGKTVDSNSRAADDPAAIRARLNQIQARKIGVNFYSPLSAKTGLGTAGRGYDKALRATGLAVESHEVPSWKQDDPQDTRLFDGIECPAESQPGLRVNLIHQNPDSMPYFVGKYGPGVLKGKFNVGIWVWELPSFRRDWQRYFGALDEVWAPSEFARQSIMSLSPVPVIRVPHVVDDLERLAIHDRSHFGVPDDVFLFLFPFDISSYMERKNPFVLIEAFKRIFGDSRKVMLLLKYHSAAYNPEAVKEMQKAAGAANIRLMSGVLSDEEAVSLHKISDGLISPHRSEGFGLNIAESMYFGKAVVATGYSGNADFMSPQNSYPVDFDLVAIERDIGPYLRGHVWANPKFDDLCEKMNLAFEDDAGRRERGKAARQTIKEMFSIEAVGNIIRARLDELGLTSQLKESAIRRAEKETIHLPAIRRGVDCEALSHQPIISVITPVYNVPAEYLDKCIRSVIAQSYPNWELCICDDKSTDPQTLAMLERYQGTDGRIKIVHSTENQGIAGASNRCVELSTGEFLAMLDNDDELHPDALYWVAKAINDHPLADLIYTDEDKIELDGRYTEQYYKPDWSPEHLRSVMYLLHMLVVRKNVFLQIGMFREEFTGAQDYDLALRVSEVTKNVVHVPQILYHWRKIPGSAAQTVDAKPYALLAAKRALEEHIGRAGIPGEVVPGKLAGMFRVRPTIHGDLPVTLVITTDGRASRIEGRGKIDLVLNFVRSIRKHTTYPNYRILVVDNGNLSPEQQSELGQSQCKIASYDGPQSPFNFAHKANFAFARVETEQLVLLNDDMEVIDGDWLTALLEFSQLRDVGAVGGKLITPDHRIQHAGVVLGVNNGAAHIYHGHPADTVGYGGFPNLIRNFSAVTGACLATRKSVLAQVGGFDERFAIDYNDTSFCLAVGKAGYRIVYTPYCELYHFESVTAQRKSQNPVEVELFNRLWSGTLANDPYYNPNLPRYRHDYVLET